MTLPVSDVDRALRLYVDQVGFTLDVDYKPNDTFRVVQLTPPGGRVRLFGTNSFALPGFDFANKPGITEKLIRSLASSPPTGLAAAALSEPRDQQPQSR